MKRRSSMNLRSSCCVSGKKSSFRPTYACIISYNWISCRRVSLCLKQSLHNSQHFLLHFVFDSLNAFFKFCFRHLCPPTNNFNPHKHQCKENQRKGRNHQWVFFGKSVHATFGRVWFDLSIHCVFQLKWSLTTFGTHAKDNQGLTLKSIVCAKISVPRGYLTHITRISVTSRYIIST